MARGLKKAIATSFGGSRGNPRGPGNRKGVDPETFRRRMQILASRAADSRRLERLVTDPDLKPGEKDPVEAKDFLAAFKECATRGYGVPTQAVDVTTNGKDIPAAQVWVFGTKPIEF